MFGGAPLTTQFFFCLNDSLTLININEKRILYHFKMFFTKTMLVWSTKKTPKAMVYIQAFKYPRYKKVFIDENTKTGFSDMKKIQITQEIYKVSRLVTQ